MQLFAMLLFLAWVINILGALPLWKIHGLNAWPVAQNKLKLLEGYAFRHSPTNIFEISKEPWLWKIQNLFKGQSFNFFHNLQLSSALFKTPFWSFPCRNFHKGCLHCVILRPDFVMHCKSCSVNTTVTPYYRVVYDSKTCTSHGE